MRTSSRRSREKASHDEHERIARAIALSAVLVPTSLAAATVSEQKPVASADLKAEKTIKAKL